MEKRDKWNLSHPFSEELKVIVQTVHIVQLSVNSRFIMDNTLDDLQRSQYNFLLVIKCYGWVDIIKYWYRCRAIRPVSVQGQTGTDIGEMDIAVIDRAIYVPYLYLYMDIVLCVMFFILLPLHPK